MFFLLLCSMLFSYELPVKLYNNSDGLPQEQVKVIVQGKDGVMYFGTLGGIGVYDGKSFKRIGLRDGLPTDEIQTMDMGNDGILWIGTPLGIAYYNGEKAYRLPLPRDMESDILKIQATEEGIYLLGKKGLYFWDRTKFNFISPADSFYYEDETLIVAKDNFLKVLKKTEEKTFELSLNAKIQVIKKYKDELYLGTSIGLFTLKNDKTVPFLLNFSITDILIDSFDCLWVTTSQEGIFLYDRGKWYHYYNFEGLPFDVVYCIMEDREKNIWFGSISGAGKISFRQILIFSELEGLVNLYVNSIYQKKDGSLWIGYRGGISKFLPEKLNFLKVENEKLKKVIVRALGEDIKGNLMLGTHDHGIFIEKGKDFYPLLTDKGQVFGRVYGMLYIPEKGTFICTKDGLYFYDGSKVISFGKESGLDVEVIYSIVKDKENNFYLATQKGVYFYDGKRFYVPERFKEIKVEVNEIFISSDDTLWVGTHGMGLFHFFENTYEVFDEQNGFPNDFIWGINEDNEGALWVATNKGIHRYQNGSWITLNSKIGLPGDEIFIHTAFKDREGNLWFGLPKGLVYLKSGETFKNNMETILKIRKIQTPERTILKVPEKLVLGPKERRLYLDYIGICLQDETEVWYQIFLKGYDEGFSVPTKENIVNYTNLKPGKYEFWLKGRNNSGLWTEPKLMFSFEILPYFYEKFLFKLGVFLLILLLGLSIYYLRVNAINKAKLKLEEMVKERTEELQKKMKIIEELSNIDPLTEIYNRRYFISRFEETLHLCKRHGEHFCFVLIDLDNFKEVNEKYGHTIGDKVLIEFSKILMKNFRETDIPARYGGDEFVLLLPKAEPEGVKNRLDALLEEIQFQAIEIEGKTVFLSFSAGVVGVYPKPESKITFDDISSFTDSFLFKAKRSGKGFVIMENFPG
ncbi:MAG: diguanylate cyclase [Thermoanaerobaculia bacterium]